MKFYYVLPIKSGSNTESEHFVTLDALIASMNEQEFTVNEVTDIYNTVILLGEDSTMTKEKFFDYAFDNGAPVAEILCSVPAKNSITKHDLTIVVKVYVTK